MIQVSSRHFQSAAKSALSITEKRNAIPALSGLAVSVNGKMELAATDLNIVSRVKIPCESKSVEQFLISDARMIADIIKKAGGANIDIETADDVINIHAGRADITQKQRLVFDDFPQQPELSSESFSATLSASLIKAIMRVAPAMSTEEVRYHLNGIRIKHVADWTYEVCATDGHRLYIQHIQLPDATGEMPEIIIPKKFCRNVIGAVKGDTVRFALGNATIPNKDGNLAPQGGATRIDFKWCEGDVELHFTSKLIDGTYPDIARVVPTGDMQAARFDAGELRRAVNVVVAGSNYHMRAVRLHLNKGNAKLSLANPVDGVDVSIPLKCDAPKSCVIEIGLNGQYFLDALNALNGDEVTFNFSEPSAPLKISDPSDTEFFIVQMPMRV